MQVNLTCNVNAVEDRLEKTVIGSVDGVANRLDQLSDLFDFFGSAKDALEDREDVTPNTMEAYVNSNQHNQHSGGAITNPSDVQNSREGDVAAAGPVLESAVQVPGIGSALTPP